MWYQRHIIPADHFMPLPPLIFDVSIPVTVTQSSSSPGGATLLARSFSLFPVTGRQQSSKLQTVVVPKRCCSCPNGSTSPSGSPAGSLAESPTSPSCNVSPLDALCFANACFRWNGGLLFLSLDFAGSCLSLVNRGLPAESSRLKLYKSAQCWGSVL